ncbi:unnamed protein product [Psylliodes chrysocephalus]|uniref:Uncharacterized protein n=1 Tax=Psylliodes chrysocephalus TaxID=3402493 RepID=A0A9P0GII2_9CUCU|nr:unnamed protein product [Psylliodes chrysocephala]
MDKSSNYVLDLKMDNLKPITLNYRELNIIETKSKKHFCKFCLKLQTKFARHMELKHLDEDEVKYIFSLPKKDTTRLKLISKIRVEGDFMYNTQAEYNTANDLIVVRRPSSNKQRTGYHFKPCSDCGGMYSHLSLISHFRRCKLNRLKGNKDVSVSSRQKSLFVSVVASDILRYKILPVLRDDQVAQTIISDDGILLFGNRLAQKYRSPHLYKMIRTRLRCVATFFLKFKEVSSLPEIKFEHVFDPVHYDNVMLSINQMCSLNRETGKYKNPATAYAIGSYLKKMSFYLISEYIKKKAKSRQEDVKDFLQLLQDGLTHDVFKTVQENQLEQKRKKKVILPSSQDIQKLRLFLEDRRDMLMKKLHESFTYNSWKELLSTVLISLQLFNRRRAGEMERVEINDFLQYEELKENDELLKNLDSIEKKKTKNYVRFLIKGKLMRGVPVMVNKANFIALKLILEHRKRANVDCKNKYLFGIQGSSSSHLSATKLLNTYSKLCGAKRPETLRGTELRKHIATKCGTMNLGKTEIKDVADYLGHHEKIHYDYYRLPNATKDIVRMSNILEKAQENNSMEDTDNTRSGIDFQYDDNGDADDITFQIDNYGDTLKDSHQHEESTDNGIIQNPCKGDTERDSSIRSEKRNSHRLSWTKEERELVSKEFDFYIKNCEMPSNPECSAFVEQNELNRSVGQLRGFISNQIQKRKADIFSRSGQAPNKVKRQRWTDEEKKKAFNIFSNELEEKKLPSLAFCKEVIQENQVFKGRTPEMFLNGPAVCQGCNFVGYCKSGMTYWKCITTQNNIVEVDANAELSFSTEKFNKVELFMVIF